MRARDAAASLLAGLALTLLASTAAANGRFPRAQRLIQDQQNPDLMALYGTYGLLVTRDAGATWRHVCEAATGRYAGEDPLLEIMAEQRIVLRTDAGLGRSDASLCAYGAVLGSASDALQDITRDSAGPNALLALTTAADAEGALVSSVASSADGGETFTPLARVPRDVLGLGLTLDVAANRPELIYLSGFDDLGRGKLARSTDRGQTFAGFTIGGLGVAAPPYIAAVSTLDPDRVFVRSDELQRSTDFEARETANDSLYFTPDGGETWHRTLTRRGKLFGFALSPDERWVLAGFGDPVLAATFVEPEDLGLYRVALDELVAAPDAPPWERIYDRSVTCLRWTLHGLFACVAQDQNGFELGRAPDASFSLAEPAPFEGLLRLPEVRPLECPAESAGAACLLEETTGWVTTCSVLRAPCDLEAAAGEPGLAEPGQAQPGAGGATGSTASPTGPLGASGLAGGSTSAGAGGAEPGASGSAANGGSSGPSGGGAARSPSGSCSTIPQPRASSSASPSPLWLLALLLTARRRPGAAPPRRADARLLALLSLATSGLGGCGDEASPRETRPATPGSDAPPVDCGGAGEDFVLGMSKTAPSGALSVAIVDADPAPPLKGPNAWTLQLSGEDGEAITAADVAFSGWMPQHDHGLNALPLITEREGGRYDVKPIILYMPQLWELEVSVTRDQDAEAVTFAFCVP